MFIYLHMNVSIHYNPHKIFFDLLLLHVIAKHSLNYAKRLLSRIYWKLFLPTHHKSFSFYQEEGNCKEIIKYPHGRILIQCMAYIWFTFEECSDLRIGNWAWREIRSDKCHVRVYNVHFMRLKNVLMSKVKKCTCI